MVMASKISAMLLSLLVMGSIAAFTPTVMANDQYEANDSFDTATEISTGTYTGAVLNGDENDYYALQVSAGETVNVTATFFAGTEPGNSPAVEILDEQGNQVDWEGNYQTTPRQETGSIRVAAEFDTAQTVFILVDGNIDQETAVDYSLSVTTQNDAFEPNGVIDAAPTISPGSYDDLTLVGDEDDYYAMDVSAGETVNVTATFFAGTEPANVPAVEILDEQGNQVDWEGNYQTTPRQETGRIRVSAEFDTAQTVYILVDGNIDQETAVDYSLSVATQNDAFEPNGVINAASTISPGTYDDLTLVGDEDDYYALQVSAGETVNVTATFFAGTEPNNAPSVSILDEQGNQVDWEGYYQTTPRQETGRIRVSAEFDTAQTVYILVEGEVDRETAPKYNLTIEGDSERFTTPIPGTGGEAPPRDPDNDGKYEDIDGDGEANFDDAVALAFADTDGLTSQQIAALDFDGDGDVDFDDAVELAFSV
jgi:PKD repeat protein